MRAKHILTLVFVVLVLALAGWSFRANVIEPHPDGEPVAVTAEEAREADAGVAGGDDDAGDGAGVPGDGVLPDTLVGRGQTAFADGREAEIQVEQLHGKDLGDGVAKAWVAQYGPQGELTVWVSRSPNRGVAEELLERMTDRIAEGGSPFRNLEPMEAYEVEGYGLDGMGQRHYYYQLERDLYWIAAPGPSSDEAVAELLAYRQESSEGSALGGDGALE